MGAAGMGFGSCLLSAWGPQKGRNIRGNFCEQVVKFKTAQTPKQYLTKGSLTILGAAGMGSDLVVASRLVIKFGVLA